MARPTKEKEKKTVEVKYKIQMLVEIEGSIETEQHLIDDTGIYSFIKWAAEDIERKLDGECEILAVKKVELEQNEV